VEKERFERFTVELTAWARTSPTIVGLVGMGSTAGGRRLPDACSDHDLIVVTVDGAADAVRADPAWVPDADRVAVRFTEPDHGLNVIYDDGHLIEFAVCDVSDLGWLRASGYGILYDEAGLDERLARAVRETRHGLATTDADGSARYHRFIKELLIGACRLARGELFSANERIRGNALPLLLELVSSLVPAADPDAADPLDPTRRVAQAHPDIAARLAGPLESGMHELLLALLDVAEEHLVGRTTVATTESLAVIRRCVARPRSAADGR
jgi:hypothetical protein